MSLFQHEQTFGERYASDATTAGTLQALAFSVQKKAPRFGSAAVHAPHRALLPQHKRKQMLASGAKKQLKQGSPVPLCRANIEFLKTRWQIGPLPSAECVPCQAMGETLDRCRARPSREQHSPRSKRLGGSTPRHLPHRPYLFAAHRRRRFDIPRTSSANRLHLWPGRTSS